MIQSDPRIMIFEGNRLRTFKHWIYKNCENVSCSAEEMAKAGFYVESEKDPGCVKCFCCMKTLNNWERNDIPFEEHKKHAPSCLFVRLGKTKNHLTINELISLSEEMDLRLLKENYNYQVKNLDEQLTNMKAKFIHQEKQSIRC